MGIAELINKEKKTAFSFEVLPPSKDTVWKTTTERNGNKDTWIA